MDNLDDSLIVLPSVDSTNNYAMGLIHSGMAKSGIAVMAYNQKSNRAGAYGSFEMPITHCNKVAGFSRTCEKS